MSRIEQVITEIEEFVERCKTVALSNSIIKVNKEEFKTDTTHLSKAWYIDKVKEYKSNKHIFMHKRG